MITQEDKIIESSKEFAVNRMRKLHSSHGWDHVERVVNLANHISETEPDANKFIVTVSAILHDIARVEEDRSNGKKCHATLGGQIAYEFLLKEGLDHKRAKHISDCSWNKLIQLVQYKAEEAGVEVVLVNPRNTTQICSGCGEIVKKDLRDRIHSCPYCGLIMDRDLNASINIHTVGTTGIHACGESVRLNLLSSSRRSKNPPRLSWG